MVQGNLKSRRLGRVQVKTSNGTKTHYVQRNRKIVKCAVTGKPLRGIPRMKNRVFILWLLNLFLPGILITPIFIFVFYSLILLHLK